MQIVPGITDHQAINFSFNLNTRFPVKPLQHPSYLSDKATLSAFKSDILHFQEQFLALNPNSNDLESNWRNFKHSLITTIDQNIPKRFPRSNGHLPWINCLISQK